MTKQVLTDAEKRCKIAFQENEGAINQIICALRSNLKDALEKFKFHGKVSLEIGVFDNEITEFNVSTTQRSRMK